VRIISTHPARQTEGHPHPQLEPVRPIDQVVGGDYKTALVGGSSLLMSPKLHRPPGGLPVRGSRISFAAQIATIVVKCNRNPHRARRCFRS